MSEVERFRYSSSSCEYHTLSVTVYGLLKGEQARVGKENTVTRSH